MTSPQARRREALVRIGRGEPSPARGVRILLLLLLACVLAWGAVVGLVLLLAGTLR